MRNKKNNNSQHNAQNHPKVPAQNIAPTSANEQCGKQKESKIEKARLTDKIIAFATFVIMGTGIFQYFEMKSGGVDTHNLAIAAIASNRAWIAPEQITLGSPVESGLPLKYQIRLVNPGKEPALGVAWNIKYFGVPYISESSDVETFKVGQVGQNTTCNGLEPRAIGDGIVLYPSGQTNFWLPLNVPDTNENRQLIDEVMKKTKSLIIEGCFAYRAGGGTHTSSFRFFLRDIPGHSFIIGKDDKLTQSWLFNSDLTGNDGN